MNQKRHRAIPGPEDITRRTLANGLTILVRENRSAPAVVVSGYLKTGAVHDPWEKLGLSSFVSALLTRGSRAYDFDTFNEIIESVGASLGVGSSMHLSDFGGKCLSEDFPMLVEVLADILRHPTFPEEQIELVRSQKLVGIQERDQDTGRVASMGFYERVYGQNHRYGQPINGYTEGVNAIQREDMVSFHERYYTPKGAVLIVVGDVETDAVLEQIERSFGDWQGSAPTYELPAIAPLEGIQHKMYPMPGKVQSDIIIGCQSIPRSHPDYDAMMVADTILGRFGMMGRLGERVREEEGLAYYSYSVTDTEQLAGSWMAVAGVNPANVQLATDSILAEFERLCEELVSDSELKDSQDYMTGILPVGLETNSGVASVLRSIEQNDLGLDYLHQYEDRVYAITPTDIQRVARAYLRKDRYVLVVAGPPDEEPVA